MGRKRGGGRARYAVYKGKERIAEGTAIELAMELGVTTDTVYFWATPSARSRGKGRHTFAERI